MEPLLELEALKVVLQDPEGDRTGTILRGVDLELHAGETLALVGESGCGKSVTALSILGLLPEPPMRIPSGTIRFQGEDLAKRKDGVRGLRGKRIGIIFQDPMSSLNPVLRVGRQVEEVLRSHSNLPSSSFRAKVLEGFREVGLPDPERVYDQYPHQLSGGMCQRVMIAMALSCGPDLLIADEPTTALDVTVQSQVLDLIFDRAAKRKMSLLFITHDLRIVQNRCDRVVILYAGEVVEEGDPGQVLSRPRHPYTRGLLASLPERAERGAPLPTIPGIVPTPFETIQGCRFADRCPKVQGKCREKAPALEEGPEGGRFRCFFPW